MKKKIFRKLLVVLIIILFVGASVSACDCNDPEEKNMKSKEWINNQDENLAEKYSIDELCGFKPPKDWWINVNFDPCKPTGRLPDTFDWRDINGVDYTTPIKNQGSCGSCWAFGTIGPLECNIKYIDGIEVDLSEQWLVSCNQDGWSCNGGWWAHDYHMWKTDPCDDTGAVLESDFPYVASDAPCNCPYPHEYLIDDWAFIGSEYGIPSVDSIKQAIMDYGPVSAAVYVNSAFQAYSGGIFDGCSSGQVNHAVVLVGWDDNQGSNGVWFLRNSWGTNWGEDGYMRIPYECSSIGYSACYVDYSELGEKTLEVTTYKITNDPDLGDFDEIDEWWDLRGGTKPEWYYRVGVKEESDTKYQFNYNRDLDDWWIFQWISEHTWNAQQVHTFHVDDTTVEITIKLMDDDVISGDDLADVSAYQGGGEDDDISDKRAAIYHGTYDLKTNKLIGDTVTEEGDYFVTIGDGINNAKVWFKISDDYEPEADLECEGSLSWSNVVPGETVTGGFYVSNQGDSGSELDWKIDSYPNWGIWKFDPNSGEDLTPEDGSKKIKVTVTAPNEENTLYTGKVKVVNKNNPNNDYCYISVVLQTPVYKQSVSQQALLSRNQQCMLMFRFMEMFKSKFNQEFPHLINLLGL